MKKMFLAAAAATALISTAAVAAVTFDAETGTGFVGKGDVQLALNLNNKQMQAQASSLSFSYSDTAEYDVYCSKTLSNKKETWTMYHTYDRDRSVSGQVAYDPRVRNQVTGFNLTGYAGAVTITGDPAVCPGGWDADPETAAENGAEAGSNVVLVGASGGTLKVNGIALVPTPTL